ncbi:aquaporin family protein [Panacibacter ginsenosidivorans]|uniref:Aquaporin family protein n=1 Tax=Panacibacter ginsenosidivorans TaxID=1813871 RepID=A0A5B8V652_9BACT|nr:aquaporin [Panacibacter ginsenosidivorans]QEC66575.1 aquaporin family protein [Panacibacter ginsenosidivorans]
MRAMLIRVITGKRGLIQMTASFKKNWIHYVQEAFGLAIFMISACFFGALLWGNDASFHFTITNETLRNVITGILMGSTALFIFYSPFTAPSGSHINPAVTITFLRLKKMCRYDAVFYIIFQCIGGTLAVYIMATLLGNVLTTAPVNYAVTIPGKAGVVAAAITEYIIAMIMMTMVLFTSSSEKFKKYTRIISGCFVCLNVIFAGPISGFGMNPARSLASAFPAHNYTAFWIYMIIPFAGMLSAAELYLYVQKKKKIKEDRTIISDYLSKKKIKIL